MLDLDLSRYQANVVLKRENEVRFIFDPIRQKYLVLQPEELVRQLFLQYLMLEKKISKNRIAVEKVLTYNGLTKRFDILIYDADTKPLIIVECKAPKIKISQAVFNQAATYNFIFRAPFLVVTNGLETHACAMDYEAETFRFLGEEEWRNG